MKSLQIDKSQKKSFKVSHYTHVFEYSESYSLLYNAKSNMLARVPKEIGGAIENPTSNPIFIKLLSHESIKQKLIKGDFIVDLEREETREALDIIKDARKNSSWLGITIAPTMSCNFSCPYCFEPKGAMGTMSDLTSSKLISFLESKLEGRKNLSVTWYGGEPTLAVERIEQLTKSIDKLVNLKKIALYCEIITNGYNLNPTIQKRLAACYISRYQITLDGPPEIHNIRRVPKSGKDSFWRIVDNIKTLMELSQVDIRVNIDRSNVEHIDALVEILSKEGILSHCSLNFSHVDAITSASYGYKNNCLSLPIFAKKTSELYRRNHNYINNPPFPESPHTCAALGPNSYVIDSKGGLYRCWTGIGDELESIGSIYDPENIRYQDTLSCFNIEENPLCKECDILPICLGGCPYKFIKLVNSKDRCVKWKFTLQETIKDYAEWLGGKPVTTSTNSLQCHPGTKQEEIRDDTFKIRYGKIRS
jgi:uncharacterized protein